MKGRNSKKRFLVLVSSPEIRLQTQDTAFPPFHLTIVPFYRAKGAPPLRVPASVIHFVFVLLLRLFFAPLAPSSPLRACHADLSRQSSKSDGGSFSGGGSPRPLIPFHSLFSNLYSLFSNLYSLFSILLLPISHPLLYFHHIPHLIEILRHLPPPVLERGVIGRPGHGRRVLYGVAVEQPLP